MKRKLRVAVLMGGKSPEHAVSLVSGCEVLKHLDSRKYAVLPIVISKDGQRWQLKAAEELLFRFCKYPQAPSWGMKQIRKKPTPERKPPASVLGEASFRLAENRTACCTDEGNQETNFFGLRPKYCTSLLCSSLLTESREISSAKDLAPTREEITLDQLPARAEVVFIAMHGPFGEDGTVQGMLELAGIPYTGAGVLASALGMDKPMFRKIVKEAGITVPQYLVLEKKDKVDKIWKNLGLPVIVKPSSQGSSVGVSLVRQKRKIFLALKKAFSFGPRVLVEEYLAGTEVTCGVLGNGNPIALPVAEIIPKKEFFDYEAKYVSGLSEEIVPARISAKLTKMVQDIAIKVYQAIGCRGFGRVDMIIKRGQPYVLEINTIPGLTPNSLLPKEAAAAGISFPQLIEKLINFALE